MSTPKPKLLLNENIGIKVADFLTKQGFDVKSTIRDFRGFEDEKLLKIAFEENRIIVTLDKDFCSLVFRDFLPCQGIILLRLRNESPKSIIKHLNDFLGSLEQHLRKKFVVIKEGKVKIKNIVKR